MLSYVNIKIIFISLVTKQGIGLPEHVHIEETAESVYFSAFGCKTPGRQIKIEDIILNDVLFYPVSFKSKAFFFNIAKPWIFSPSPQLRRHYVCKNERIEEFRKNKDFHV